MALEVQDVVYQGGGLIVTFTDGSWTTAIMETVGGVVRYSGLTNEQREALRRFNQTNVSQEVSEADARVGITSQQAQVIQQEVTQITQRIGGAAPYDAWGNGRLSLRLHKEPIFQASNNLQARISAQDLIQSIQASPNATLTYGIRIWSGEDGFGNNYDGNGGNPGPLSQNTDPKKAYIDFNLSCEGGLLGAQTNIRVYVSSGANTVFAWTEALFEDQNGFNGSGPVTLLSPPNGPKVFQPVTGIPLDWSQAFPAVGAGSLYNVIWDVGVNPPTSVRDQVPDSNYVLPPSVFPDSSTIYWRIGKIDCQGIENNLISPVWSFQTGILPEEVDFGTYSPPEFGVVPGPGVLLSWGAAVGATGYDVWFAKEGELLVKVASNIPGTSLNIVGPLDDPANYSWRVESRNADGVKEGIQAIFTVDSGGGP